MSPITNSVTKDEQFSITAILLDEYNNNITNCNNDILASFSITLSSNLKYINQPYCVKNAVDNSSYQINATIQAQHSSKNETIQLLIKQSIVSTISIRIKPKYNPIIMYFSVLAIGAIIITIIFIIIGIFIYYYKKNKKINNK